MSQALDIEVRRVERSWAGLRTFTPDGSLALGQGGEGYFWCVGQGGYGIQSSVGVGKLMADLIAGRECGYDDAFMRQIDPNRFP